MQLGELVAHAHAQRTVQVGQGFVKQKYFGFAHNGATNGYALALTARQVLGLALQQVFDVQNLGSMTHRAVDLGGVDLGQLKTKSHVVVQVHVRVQRVRLKHHGNAALGRWDVVDAPAANGEVAPGNFFQPGDGAQQG